MHDSTGHDNEVADYRCYGNASSAIKHLMRIICYAFFMIGPNEDLNNTKEANAYV